MDLKEFVFVEKSEEIKNLEKELNPRQKIQFKCWRCEKISKRSLYRLQQKDYELICTNCAKYWKSALTKLQKYGTLTYTNPEKIKQTKLERYGNANYNNKVLYKQTCLKRYGVENPQQNVEIHEKTKQTNLIRFGAESSFSNAQVREKVKQTCLKRYGSKNPFGNKEVREKAKQTCLKKYGYEYSQQNPKIRRKQVITRRETLSKKPLSFWKDIQSKHQRKYTYQDISFDSSWELALWIYAKDHNEKIIREPIILEYFVNNEKHYYFPDFLYKDNLLEIKGDHFFDESGNLCGFEGKCLKEKQKCMQENNVVIWTSKDIKIILDYIFEKYGKNYLQQFRNKKS